MPENEDKIMICSFFKFSILEHFWVLKWIAWVDIRVVLIFYSFQGVRVDLEGELEKWTKCTQIGKLAKLQLIVIMIVFLAFQLKWYISNSKVKPLIAKAKTPSLFVRRLEEDDIKLVAVKRIKLLGMNKVDRERAEKTEGIQRGYNMAVAMLRGDV